MTKIKITPLFIVLIILEAVLIFTAFYYLLIENNGGMALAGVIALFASVLNAVLIGIEQAIVEIMAINVKILWSAELLIIACAIGYLSIYGISIG